MLERIGISLEGDLLGNHPARDGLTRSTCIGSVPHRLVGAPAR
jgi:hypothetical protein